MVIYTLKGAYRTWQSYTFLYDIIKVFESHIYLVVSFVIFAYLYGSLLVYNSSVIIYWALGSAVIVVTSRSVVYLVLLINKKRRIFVKKAVLCGISNACVELIEWIRSNPWSAIDIVGVLTRHTSASTIYNIPVVGDPENVVEFVKEHNINVVYLTFDSYEEKYIQNLVSKLFDTTCSIQFATDVQAMNFLQYMTVKYLGCIPVISVVENPITRHMMLFKRLEDIALSLIFIIISAPLMLIAAFAIKLTTPGSVIFKQLR